MGILLLVAMIDQASGWPGTGVSSTLPPAVSTSNWPGFAKAYDLYSMKVVPRIGAAVADDADAVGVGQFHQDDHVRALFGQGGVHRVPDPFVAVDDPFGGGLLVAQVEGMAAVAHPFRSPLPAVAAVAAFHRRQRPSDPHAVIQRHVICAKP